ncbi:MAG TPA: hypothetical protein VLJ14_15705, partial [Ktedonobacterales bacterium]|nr:hypothetical protein [Ktedonobacterales bacterium]
MTVMVAALFAVFGSKLLAVTLAVLEMMVPVGAFTVTISVTVKLAPAARLLAPHVTVPVPPTAGAAQLPSVVVTPEKVALAGTVSVNWMALAPDVPLLLTAMVYVSCVPERTG